VEWSVVLPQAFLFITLRHLKLFTALIICYIPIGDSVNWN
jgi:hypothetical protein